MSIFNEAEEKIFRSMDYANNSVQDNAQMLEKLTIRVAELEKILKQLDNNTALKDKP